MARMTDKRAQTDAHTRQKCYKKDRQAVRQADRQRQSGDETHSEKAAELLHIARVTDTRVLSSLIVIVIRWLGT
jgi:restriction endonuclease Mrr